MFVQRELIKNEFGLHLPSNSVPIIGYVTLFIYVTYVLLDHLR